MSECEPNEKWVEIMNISKNEKGAFIDSWRVANRQRCPRNRKDELIQRIFDFLKGSNQW